MPQPDTAGELGQLTECFADKERLVFTASQTDLLDDPGKIGIAQSIGLLSDTGRPLTERIQGAHLLRILKMIDLFRQMDHERIDFQLQFRIFFAQRANGFSSLFHAALIGRVARQLNRIKPQIHFSTRSGVEEGEAQPLPGRRFQSE